MSKIISMHRTSDGRVVAQFTGEVSHRDVAASLSHIGNSVARKDNARKAPKITRSNGQDQASPATSPANDNAARIPTLKAQTPAQRFYISDLKSGSSPFVVAHGPAGTGKTYPAVINSVERLIAGGIKKLVITRPLVNVEEEEVGTLPGGIIEKVSPWMLPILDILKEVYSTHELRRLLETEVIEIAPLAFMRGRTFKKCILIADEAQNMTPSQMKMLLTRIGEGSRFIITGDVEQTDRKTGQNGLLDLVHRLDQHPSPNFAVTTFHQRDIVRHRAIDGVLSMHA